ncbi:MAG: hypothetical protein ACLT78_14980, partial [Escherichia coli]
ADDTERDQLQAIFDAVDELSQESPGDILIFMSGEREIRDTADALNKLNLRHTEILPRFMRGFRTANKIGCSSRTAGDALCWRPTSRKRR